MKTKMGVSRCCCGARSGETGPCDGEHSLADAGPYSTFPTSVKIFGPSQPLFSWTRFVARMTIDFWLFQKFGSAGNFQYTVNSGSIWAGFRLASDGLPGGFDTETLYAYNQSQSLVSLGDASTLITSGDIVEVEHVITDPSIGTNRTALTIGGVELWSQTSTTITPNSCNSILEFSAETDTGNPPSVTYSNIFLGFER